MYKSIIQNLDLEAFQVWGFDLMKNLLYTVYYYVSNYYSIIFFILFINNICSQFKG